MNVISGLGDSDAAVIGHISNSSPKPGDAIYVTVTFQSYINEPIRVLRVGFHGDWMGDQEFQGPNLMNNPVTVEAKGSYSTQFLIIVPSQVSVGSHNYIVGVDGSDQLSNTYSWDSPNYTLQVETSHTNSPTPTASPIPANHGLVGYWKFDENQGANAFDSSSYANNGAILGATWTQGKYSAALNFDGNNDYVSIPDSNSLRVQSFSLVSWVNLSERPYQIVEGAHHHSAIINKINFKDNTGTTGYKIQFEHPTSDNDHLVITIGDGAAQRFLIDYNSINDLTINQWHQIIGTWNGNTASIYIDGQLKSSISTNSYTIVHDSTALTIGAEPPVGVRCDFKGKIDQVMVYNRALSSQEIIDLYNNSYDLPSPTPTNTPPTENPTNEPQQTNTPTSTGNLFDSLKEIFGNWLFYVVIIVVIVVITLTLFLGLRGKKIVRKY
ncbi:MAG: LamG domain-containing protein [Thermoproteota archaeon]|nr:LamG domain-containing protein [Thermoproteota archaeon]NLD65850.1 LamG domain-containing protein [Thermoproteota archaeon]